MGCDIHGYLEWREPGQNWQGFSGRVRLNRWYAIFGALAGVREDQPEGLVAPRGLPTDAAWETKWENSCRIVKDTESEESGECHLANAQRWVTQKSSVWLDEKLSPVAQANPGELADFEGQIPAYKYVTHPDWHSHSWLNPEEFAKALRLAALPQDAPQYYAVLAAMRQFVVAGKEARLVFWFDN